MAAQYLPKTLAKTLAYISYHAPGEHGLFWESDGTMPWKDLYWVLQEDPTLRFVREATLKELSYLGTDLPFELEGKLLRLKSGVPVPDYPVAEPPERLFYACRRKHYHSVSSHGLFAASNRTFLCLASDEDLALRLGQRREAEPFMIQIKARQASQKGIPFREAGSGLYLAESVSLDYLVLPMIRQEELARITLKKQKEEKSTKPKSPLSPGSFIMDINHFQEQSPDKGPGNKVKKKGKRGPSWKREARNERHKRNL